VSEVTALGDGRFLLTDNGRTTLAHAVSAADAACIFVNG
jgi:hypothetical protein